MSLFLLNMILLCHPFLLHLAQPPHIFFLPYPSHPVKKVYSFHLNDIGHPIIGDKKYGASKNPISRLGLHAYYLEFKHPVSKENMVIKTSFPKEFEKIFEKK